MPTLVFLFNLCLPLPTTTSQCTALNLYYMENVSKEKDFLRIVGGRSGRKPDMEQKYLSRGTKKTHKWTYRCNRLKNTHRHTHVKTGMSTQNLHVNMSVYKKKTIFDCSIENIHHRPIMHDSETSCALNEQFKTTITNIVS